jgi:hypothetical protein
MNHRGMTATETPHDEDHPADGLICSHVFNGDRPVLFAYREEDGFWTFTCGGTDHNDREDVVPVCHGCALDENDLRRDLGALQPGYEASRASVDDPWRFERSRPDASS